MTDLIDLSLAAARDAIASRQITAVELVGAYTQRVESTRALNAFITETLDQALARARAVDAGQVTGSMAGIPIGIKDLFCTKGVQTTAGSAILKGFVPPYDSTVSAKLESAGAISLGKLNLDEFAMGSSNATSHYGPVTNPWKRSGDDRALVPGGSSGGSAAAVATRSVLAATATDTGGSIRQPAAFTGTAGIKPTYGRCSRFGIVAFASSLDQAGVIARDVRDSAIMLQVMCGHDPQDSTSAPLPVPNWEAALTGDIRGLKIGVPKEYRLDGTNPEILALWDRGLAWAKAAGAEIIEVSLPHTRYALATYYIVAPAEASSNLARYDGVRFGQRVPGKTLDEMYENTRAAGFGAEVKRRILIGTYTLSAGYYDAYYLKAQKVRALIARDFADAFKTVDVMLTPTAPTAAFALGEKMDDPIAMYLNDVFTVPASLAGLPAMSIPAGLSGDGLPLGLHLIGKPFDEATVLRTAHVLEQQAGFTARPAGY